MLNFSKNYRDRNKINWLINSHQSEILINIILFLIAAHFYWHEEKRKNRKKYIAKLGENQIFSVK